MLIHPVAGIHLDFDHRSRIRVCGRGSHAAALVLRGRELRRRVGTNRANRAEPGLPQADSFLEGDSLFRRCGVEYAVVREAKLLFRHLKFFGHRFRQHGLRSFGGLDGCVPSHQGHAARVRSQVHRSEVGIARVHTDIRVVMPRTSATINASTSSEPCPISLVPEKTVTPPPRSSLS